MRYSVFAILIAVAAIGLLLGFSGVWYGWAALGVAGPLTLLGLYLLIMIYGVSISLRSRTQFGRLLAMGVTSMLFFYVFINIAMVMGLIPVVGVPLPLISYGGTAMLTLMIGIGLLICVHIHRDLVVSRHGNSDS